MRSGAPKVRAGPIIARSTKPPRALLIGDQAKLVDLAQDIFPREQLAPQALLAFSQGRDREMVAGHQGRRIKAE